MNEIQKIAQAERLVRKNRRIKELIVAVAGLSLSILLGLTASYFIFPGSLTLSICVAVCGLFITWAVVVIWSRRVGSVKSQVAKTLDRELSAKDRFVSFFDLESNKEKKNDPRLQVLKKQLNTFLKDISIESYFGFNFTKPYKLTLYSMPVIWVFIGLLLWQQCSSFFPNLNPEQVELIENVLDDAPNLPNALRNSLGNLSDALSKNEFTDEEVKEALEQAQKEYENAVQELKKEQELKEKEQATLKEKKEDQAEKKEEQKKEEIEKQKKEKESSEKKKSTDKQGKKESADNQNTKQSQSDSDKQKEQGQQPEQSEQGEGQEQSDSGGGKKEGQSEGDGQGQGQASEKQGKESGENQGEGQAEGSAKSKSGEGQQQQGQSEGKQAPQSQDQKQGESADQKSDQSGSKSEGLSKTQQALSKVQDKMQQEQSKKEGSQKSDKKESKGAEKDNQQQKEGSSGQESKQGDKKKSEEHKSGDSGGGEQSKSESSEDDSQTKEPLTKDPNISSLPRPSENAPKMGKFEGGEDSKGLEGPKEFKKVDITEGKEQSKLESVSGEGNLAENPFEATSKLDLQDIKRAKPGAVKEKGEQLVPLEYKDLM